jgi:hypothetical protein
VNPGDRVFCKGLGAGWLIGPLKHEPSRPSWRQQPPVRWQIVELDTGRRIPVNPEAIKVIEATSR